MNYESEIRLLLADHTKADPQAINEWFRRSLNIIDVSPQRMIDAGQGKRLYDLVRLKLGLRAVQPKEQARGR
jgi:hypothetical protein